MSRPGADFLRLYEEDLEFLRGAAGAFATDHPEVARALGITDGSDPSIDRLLEGVAFLGARVGLKIQASQEQVARELLSAVFPILGQPVPAAGVVRLDPELGVDQLSASITVPRGTPLTLASPGTGDNCEFRTCHELRLDPIELVETTLISAAGLGAVRARLPGAMAQARAAIRFRLSVGRQAQSAALTLRSLDLFVQGDGATASRILKPALVDAVGVAVVDSKGKLAFASELCRPEALGFAETEALFDAGSRGYPGHRFLVELMVIPERFQFLRIPLQAPSLAEVSLEPSSAFDVLVLLKSESATLAEDLLKCSWHLRTTPIVNEYERRLDRTPWMLGQTDTQLVVDRLQALAHEILRVQSVSAYRADGVAERARSVLDPRDDSVSGSALYFHTVRRILAPWRLRGGSNRRAGKDGGKELRPTALQLTLLGRGGLDDVADVTQIGVAAVVCDADRPARVWRAGGFKCSVDASGGLLTEWLVPPTHCHRRHLAEADVWKLVGSLRQSLEGLLDPTGTMPVEQVHQLLSLFAVDRGARSQRLIQSVRGVNAQSSIRAVPGGGPLAYCRGIELTVEASAEDLDSTPVFLLSMVLDRYFAGHASINAFTALRVRTPAADGQWAFPPRRGTGELL